MQTTSCSNDHEEIHFEGYFSALCPLCAARAALAEAEEKASEWERRYEEAPAEEEMNEARKAAENFEKRCDENEAAISAIVHSEGDEREEAIKAAAKLID